tara:strand:+ start:627 stop:929 length:303 start_codon:yes stop_codon:yes gene_type:complete
MAEATTVGDSLPSIQTWFSTGWDNFVTGNWLELTWPQLIFWPIIIIFVLSVLIEIWSESRRNSKRNRERYGETEKPFYKGYFFWFYVGVLIFTLIGSAFT